MGISEVKLSDKIIREKDVVDFLADCLRETGGIRSVSTKLSRMGYSDFHEVASHMLNSARQTGRLDLSSYSSGQIRNICECVVNELNSCQDLDTLMNLTFESASNLLRKI